MLQTHWKSVFYLLESQGLRCWLLNAKHVKNLPGRPKTDKLDAVWLATDPSSLGDGHPCLAWRHWLHRRRTPRTAHIPLGCALIAAPCPVMAPPRQAIETGMLCPCA